MIKIIRSWIDIYFFKTYIEEILKRYQNGQSLIEITSKSLKMKGIPKYYKKNIMLFCKDINKGLPLASCIKHLLPTNPPFILNSQRPIKHTLLLRELRDYYQSRLSNASKFLKNISYPILLFHLCIGILGIFLTYIIPSQKRLLSSINSTENISLSFHIVIIGSVYLVTIGSLFYLFKYILFSTKSKMDFLWMLGLLIKSGLSLKEALDSINMNKSKYFKEFQQILMTKGDLKAALFNGKFSQDIHIQALLNQNIGLDTLFLNIAQLIQKNNQSHLERITKTIQPLLLIGISIIIGIIIITFFHPLMNQIQQFSL